MLDTIELNLTEKWESNVFYNTKIPYLFKHLENFELRIQEWKFSASPYRVLGWRWDIYDKNNPQKIVAFGYCGSAYDCEKILLSLVEILKKKE